MNYPNRNPNEEWQEIAEQVSQEQDPKKLIELANKLIETIDQERKSPKSTGG